MSVRFKIKNCLRCGSDHVGPDGGGLEFVDVNNPAEFTHWALCPTTGEPLIVNHNPGVVDLMKRPVDLTAVKHKSELVAVGHRLVGAMSDLICHTWGDIVTDWNKRHSQGKIDRDHWRADRGEVPGPMFRAQSVVLEALTVLKRHDPQIMPGIAVSRPSAIQTPADQLLDAYIDALYALQAISGRLDQTDPASSKVKTVLVEGHELLAKLIPPDTENIPATVEEQ